MKRLIKIFIIALFLLIPNVVKADRVNIYVFHKGDSVEYDNLLDMLDEIKVDNDYKNLFDYFMIDTTDDVNYTNALTSYLSIRSFNKCFYVIGNTRYIDFVEDKTSSSYVAKKELLKTQIKYYSTHEYTDMIDKFDDEYYNNKKSKSSSNYSSDSVEDNFVYKFVNRLVKDRTYRIVVMSIVFALILFRKLGKTVKKYR